MAKKIKYDVLSPDGFSIHRTDIYNTIKQAENALKEWAKRYERQGYYSANSGRIRLEDLALHCKIIPIK